MKFPSFELSGENNALSDSTLHWVTLFVSAALLFGLLEYTQAKNRRNVQNFVTA